MGVEEVRVVMVMLVATSARRRRERRLRLRSGCGGPRAGEGGANHSVGERLSSNVRFDLFH